MNVETCRHWIGSDERGRVCGAIADGDHGFCVKHLEVQRRRVAKDLARRREQRERAEAAWRARNVPRLPSMRTALERAEAERARRTTSPVTDTAAVGGATHASIVRAQAHHLSDRNVDRVLELERLIKSLRADIARAEVAA